jgi:competence protein ComEA
MNPFLHDTIARSVGVPPSTAPSTAARALAPTVRRFVRLAGQLAFAAGVAMAAGSPAQAVDVNAATQPELESVRGVGPKTAELILRERQKGGAFKSFEDFSGRVRGIGAKRAQKLRDAGLTVGPASTSTAAASPPPGAAVLSPPVLSAGAARNTPRAPGGKPN